VIFGHALTELFYLEARSILSGKPAELDFGKTVLAGLCNEVAVATRELLPATFRVGGT
jgi:hypothetical protein